MSRAELVRFANKTAVLCSSLRKKDPSLLALEKMSTDICAKKFLKTSDASVPCQVTVENIDVLSAVVKMNAESKDRVLVLNCASEKHQGGGWLSGAQAVEESIFRGSTLCLSLDVKYPWSGDPAYYSPKVQLLSKEPGVYLEDDKRILFSCFSVAGIRRPKLLDGKFSPQDEERVMGKIVAFLETAEAKGHTHIVATALGCGAFRGPPEHTARIFQSVIKKFTGLKILFAIKSPKSEGLDVTFQRVLCPEKTTEKTTETTKEE